MVFENVTTPQQLVVETTSAAPFLMPMILFLVFIIIGVSGAIFGKKNYGNDRFILWFAIAGLIVTTGEFFLFLEPGIIDIYTLTISVVITIVLSLILLITPNQSL